MTDTISPDGLTFTKDRNILEPDGTLAERAITTEQVFPFGKRTTRQERFIVQPNGTILGSRSTFSVYGQPGYGLLSETYTDYDGTWAAYTYTADGVATIRRPYREAGRGSADADLELTTVDWHRGHFGMGATDDLAKITTRTLAGNVVSRVVEVFFKDALIGTLGDGVTPFDFNEHWTIVLTDPSVATVAGALATSASLVTKTRTYASGPYEDQIRSILHPDGTITILQYAPNQTVRWTGVASADGHSITEGIRSELVMNDHGELITSQSVTLPQNLVIAEEIALAHDAFGRPTQVRHLDGSHSFKEYTCCGLASETERDGVTTTYVRDMLGRVRSQTRIGVTTTFDLSATGRIRSVTESGEGISIVRATTATDSLGTQTISTDAHSRSTVTAEFYEPPAPAGQ